MASVQSNARWTALKVSFRDEIHRVRIDLNSFSLLHLQQLFIQTFQLTPNAFVIQYKDAEGDCLNVCSDAEYAEAVRVFMTTANGDAHKSLKFVATAKNPCMMSQSTMTTATSSTSPSTAAFHENVGEPIVMAIENLVQSLNAAMDKVKKEEWAQRAQHGVDKTNDALQQAARDARATLVNARQSIQEIPFDQFVRETTEGLKTAAEGISTFAHGLVGQLIPEEDKEEKKQEDPDQDDDIDYKKDEEELLSENQEPEVHVPAPAPAPVEAPAPAPAPVVEAAPEPVVSPAAQRWSDELALISGILPGIDVHRVIEMLEQANGNVEVVLDALMEEM